MIEKIILENYRCYSKHTEDFQDGLNIIAGANGIGKTSIVEAIAYALFGNKMTRGKANDWIKTGKKHGKVKLYIDDHIITRGDNEQLVENSKGKVIARLNTGVDEWVLNTYGLTSELFSTANYIAQKDIESFSGLQTAERIKRVEKLLRINVLDEIKEQVKEDIKDTKRTVKEYSNYLSDVIFNSTELTSLKKKKRKENVKLTTAKKAQRAALVSKGAYDAQLDQWNTKCELEILMKELVYSKIPYTMQQLVTMQKIHERNSELCAEANKLDVVPDNVQEELVEARDLYNSLVEQVNLLKDISETCPTCKQSLPNAKELIDKRKDLQKELEEVKEVGTSLAEIQKKYDLLSAVEEGDEEPDVINQMMIDIEKLYHLDAYNSVKDIKKPTKSKVRDADNLVSSLTVLVESLTEKINTMESSKTLLKLYEKPLEDAKNRLETSQEFVKFIDKYRKEFSQNVIPLISKNANTIFNHLTDSKFPKFKIEKDYSINNYDKYSGSESDSASFALRMAIAQVSRIKGFDSIILDEIAASFDMEKEKLLLDILEKTSQQLIYISHGDIT